MRLLRKQVLVFLLIVVLVGAAGAISTFSRRNIEALSSPQADSVAESDLVQAAAKMLPDTVVGFTVLDLKAYKNGNWDKAAQLFNADRLLALGNYGNNAPPRFNDLVAQLGLALPFSYMRIPNKYTAGDVQSWMGDYAIIALNRLSEVPAENYLSNPNAIPPTQPSSTNSYSYETYRQESLRHEFIVIVPTTNEVQALNLINRIRSDQSNITTSQINEYTLSNGSKLIYQSAYTRLPVGVISGVVIMGMPKSVEAVLAVQKGAKSLESAGVYKADLGYLPGKTPLYSGWYNLNSEMGLLFTGLSTTNPSFPPVSALVGAAATSARLLDNGVAFDFQYRGKPPVAYPNVAKLGAEKEFLARYFPPETLFMGEARNLDLLFNFGKNALTEGLKQADNPSWQAIDGGLRRVEAQLGINITDVLGKLNTPYAIGILESPRALADLPFAFVALTQTNKADDAKYLTDTLTDTLLSLRLNPQKVTVQGKSFYYLTFGQVSLTYGNSDTLFLIGSGDSANLILKQASDTSAPNLLTNPKFKTALQTAGDLGRVYVYYDNEATIRLLRASTQNYTRNSVEDLNKIFSNIGVVFAKGDVYPDKDTLTASLYFLRR